MSLVNAHTSPNPELSLALPCTVTTADGTHQSHYEGRGKNYYTKVIRVLETTNSSTGKANIQVQRNADVQQQNQPISARKNVQHCQSHPALQHTRSGGPLGPGRHLHSDAPWVPRTSCATAACAGCAEPHGCRSLSAAGSSSQPKALG